MTARAGTSIRLSLDDWALGHTRPEIAEGQRNAAGLRAVEQDVATRAVENPFRAESADPNRSMAAGGRASVLAAHAEHEHLIRERGVGRFYGARSRYAKLPARTQRFWLSLKLPDDVSAREVHANLLSETCISWAMRHVASAYAAAGRTDRWAAIARTLHADDLRGTTLAQQLQADGWTAVYFAPDSRRLQGDSPYARHAQRALRQRRYHGIRIDVLMIDYRTRGSKSVRPTPELQKLADVPFFFGLVRSGEHVFVGVGDEVSEMHWASNPHSKTAVERRPLASEDFRWREGLLMVPPGAW